MTNSTIDEKDTTTPVLKGEGCPYAAAVHSDDSTVGDTSTDTLLQSCPAFQKGACPFAACQNDAEIRQMLLQIPSSHYEESSGGDIGKQFLRVLHELHAARPSSGGQCPVAAFPVKLSFTEAIEGHSLAEIMARLAQGSEPVEQQQEEKDHVSNINDTKVTPPLSETIKRGTAESHSAAENVHFVKNFIRGQVDRTLFAELVQKLFFVYRTLEELLRQHTSSLQLFAEFHHALQRTDALLEDLDFWFGPAEAARIASVRTPSPATQDYLDRLHYCAQHQPELLLAHSYTRYLGDLSGGAILARVARKALQLSGDGLAFYDFHPAISNPKDFKNQYRRALDQWTLSAASVEALVQEANIAFGLNMRLFEELDVQGRVPGATLRPLSEVLAPPPPNRPVDPAADAECPFAKIRPTSNASTNTTVHSNAPTSRSSSSGGCPWPFVLLHDPVRGLADWRSWTVLGLLLALLWRQQQQQQHS